MKRGSESKPGQHKNFIKQNIDNVKYSAQRPRKRKDSDQEISAIQDPITENVKLPILRKPTPIFKLQSGLRAVKSPSPKKEEMAIYESPENKQDLNEVIDNVPPSESRQTMSPIVERGSSQDVELTYSSSSSGHTTPESVYYSAEEFSQSKYAQYFSKEIEESAIADFLSQKSSEPAPTSQDAERENFSPSAPLEVDEEEHAQKEVSK